MKKYHPFIRFIEGDEGTPEGGAAGGAPKAPEFPADTSVKDMTPEQQAAYWKHHARKHEDRVKEFGTLTPEQVRKNAEDLEELRKKGLSDSERAVEEALERVRTEAKGQTAVKVVDSALRIALRGRLVDGGALLSKPSFVKDGEADIDAIEKWVDENSAPKDGGGGGKPFPNLFQGERESLNKSDRETGKAAAEKRFGKKS